MWYFKRFFAVGLMVLLFSVLAVSPAFAKRMPPKHLSASQAVHKAIIVKVAKAAGYGLQQTNALLILGWRESGWRPTARTGNCRGAFQLNFNHMGNHWKDLAWNTRRAIKYIKHRYGTPSRALAHSYSRNWY